MSEIDGSKAESQQCFEMMVVYQNELVISSEALKLPIKCIKRHCTLRTHTEH